MDPFVPKMPKREVIHRKVMDTIANRVTTWDEHATIVSGRPQTGKTAAVEEVLRGARGIFKHTVESENWKKELYESLQVDGPGMFETVLVRVKAELVKLTDPITKTPIILFEVPRTTTKGMDTISSTTKDLSTEGGKAAHVIISASSAVAALAFDAGGANRQKDIWIDDLTAEEAKKVLTLHGHEENAQDIIEACASVARVVRLLFCVDAIWFCKGAPCRVRWLSRWRLDRIVQGHGRWQDAAGVEAGDRSHCGDGGAGFPRLGGRVCWWPHNSHRPQSPDRPDRAGKQQATWR
ncbi:unnamed protein product [Symbiodinium pilosum]|uniref:Uncharacterized protein n=1 Tax=Symbiodinium pilosum TaxID=2952 RepID=A0A812UAQ7_SYMPI|nr:unnamed protein product [Symbiodinium pilosum]